MVIPYERSVSRLGSRFLIGTVNDWGIARIDMNGLSWQVQADQKVNIMVQMEDIF